MTGAQQITPALAEHGEGPVWAASWGGLCWVDMLRGDILQLDPSTGRVRRFNVARVAAAVRPRTSGGVIVAVERGFALADNLHGPWKETSDIWAEPDVRMNDGGCDPSGNFWCGSMAYDERRGAGSLYRVTPAGDVHAVLDGVTISNGIDWSPDGRTAYYIDSPTQRVDTLTTDDGGITYNRRTAFEILPELGTPDGLTVDADGHVWVALWGGGAVHRYSPTGALEQVITLPVQYVTACTFGGSSLTDLYITTSRLGKDGDVRAGALWLARPGVTGQETRCYRG